MPENFIACDDRLMVDFGAAYGLFSYSAAGGWQSINPSDADRMVAVDADGDGQQELAVSFTGYGLYLYETGTGTWTRINISMPEQMIAASNDLMVDFGSAYGLFGFAAASGWRVINRADPVNMAAGDLDGDGTDELLVGFAGYGLYHFSLVGVTRLNVLVPEQIISIR